MSFFISAATAAPKARRTVANRNPPVAQRLFPVVLEDSSSALVKAWEAAANRNASERSNQLVRLSTRRSSRSICFARSSYFLRFGFDSGSSAICESVDVELFQTGPMGVGEIRKPVAR